MGKVGIGVNMEFVRHADKPFEWGVEKAAELGYEYVEPRVHLGRELMSEAGYYMTVSMSDDPYRIRRACEKAGIKLSGLSSHTALCRPDIGGNYLKQAIRFAAECGAPVVNTDEGPKPPWTTKEEDHVLMKYTLTEAARLRGEPRHPDRHRAAPAVQQDPGRPRPHRQPRGFAGHRHQLRHGQLLPGRPRPDRVAGTRTARLVHLHAKDISIQHSEAERGKVTGTPVGCACGDGVIDWKKVIQVCRRASATSS